MGGFFVLFPRFIPVLWFFLCVLFGNYAKRGFLAEKSHKKNHVKPY